MNQPKFKMGDTVATTQPPWMVFRVDGIRRKSGDYEYAEENCSFYHEEQLELYQEPQKKKLYAYRDTGGRFIFTDFNFDNITDRHNILHVRAPEYDIEYPSSEEE